MTPLVALIPAIVLAAAFPGSAHGAPSAGADLDVPAIFATEGPRLTEVTSDDRARHLFESRLLDVLRLPKPPSEAARPRTKNAPPLPSSPPVSEFIQTGGELTAHLAAWRLADGLKRAATERDTGAIGRLVEQARPQQEWLAQRHGYRSLEPLFRLASAAALFRDVPDDPAADESRYSEFAGSLDQNGPKLSGEGSWVAIAETEGAAGIMARLGVSGNGAATSETGVSEARFAPRYFRTRLQPVLLASLVAGTITTEAEAEHRARLAWASLKGWPERVRETRGLLRLCGTWNWTVHNHQNHLDHKSTMIFSAPGSQAAVVKPTKTVVLGDVVYLRWDYPGGFQEDSLLFTGEGQRLEGTFVNSSGAWGSITGKRIAPCAP
ncbi:hypothetical protein [Candidatus Nitrospira bockiana]